jgi:hypothetical protein
MSGYCSGPRGGYEIGVDQFPRFVPSVPGVAGKEKSRKPGRAGEWDAGLGWSGQSLHSAGLSEAALPV